MSTNKAGAAAIPGVGETGARERAKYRGIPPSEAAARLSAKLGRPVTADFVIRHGKAGSFAISDVSLPGAKRKTYAVNERSFMRWLGNWDAEAERVA